jgi:Zn-dependent metalloprotease
MLGGAATSLALAAASLAVASPATAAPPDSPARAVAKLKAASDRTPSLTTDPSGVVRNLRAAPGHPVERPAGVRKGAKAEVTARGVVRTYAAAFGLKDDAALRTTSTTRTPGGHDVVRFQQTVGGLPVLGGDLITTVRPDGGTLSVNSTVSTAPVLATEPRVTANRAAATARTETAKTEKLRAGSLKVATPELVMFDPAAFGASLRAGLRPVWRAKVTGESPRGPVAADVLVDARSGAVTLYADALHAARNRQVCNHNAVAADSEPGFAGDLCPSEQPLGQPVPGGTVQRTETSTPAVDEHADVTNAFDFSGRTYDFYKTLFNRDSVDGLGKQLRSSVRYCPMGSFSGNNCYGNAFWDGEQMVYGPGFASADDVVGHELAHGVIQHTANLFYWYQAGAINESMADVFGELVDRFDNAEGAEPQWLIGEDLPIGAIRSMADPELYQNPKSMTSTMYQGATGSPTTNDNGGVHVNSGVGNYAAYLIASGLGGDAAALSKTAHLYYATLTNLSSGADYADLARTLQSSCATLVDALVPLPAMQVGGAGPATVSVTADDCAVVNSAIATTEMTAQPTLDNAAAPEAPFCPDGFNPAPAQTGFSDDMENPASGNWAYTVQDLNRDPWDASTDYFTAEKYGASYARSGQTSMIGLSAIGGTDTVAGNVGRIQSTTLLTIPTGIQPFLWFAHADNLTDGLNDGARVSAVYTDGGVEHTVDLGVGDASTLPAVNGYNAKLTGDARWAFTGDSHGYVSTRFDLSRLAGKSVKFAFDIVGDGSGETNWWIDDVLVYSCAGPAPTKPTALTATPTSTSAVTLSWTPPTWAGDTGLKEYVVEGGPNGAVTVPAEQQSLSVTGLSAKAAYQFAVKAVATDDTPGPTTSVSVVPTSSTLLNSVASMTYGGTTTLSGTVTQAGTSTKIAGATVRIQAWYAGGSAWATAGTVKTTSAGAWKLAHKPYRNVTYRMDVAAMPGRWGAVGSKTVSTGVAARLNASFGSSTIRLGQTASVSVAVAPGRKYTVELQQRVGSRWVLVQRKVTNSKGAVFLSVKPTKRGKYTYRVVTHADTYNRAGATSTRSLTVR